MGALKGCWSASGPSNYAYEEEEFEDESEKSGQVRIAWKSRAGLAVSDRRGGIIGRARLILRAVAGLSWRSVRSVCAQ